MSLTIKPTEPTQDEETRALIEGAPASGSKLLPGAMAGLLRTFCGCGRPQDAWAWVLVYLNNCKLRQWHKLDSGAEWIAAYLLDRLGLTTHGGSVSSSFLTPNGEAVLAFLLENGEDWMHEGEWIDGNGVSWGNP